jgi:hypothetical protein
VRKHGLLHGELVAESVRATSRLPAVSSAFDYCRELNVPVFIEPGAPPRLCGVNIPRYQAIGVAPESNERRLNFTVAHELGHLHMDGPVPFELWEAMANRFAGALLCPAWEFLESVREFGLDPRTLQRTWRFSSMECLASRVGELLPRAAAAAWCEYSLRWRRSTMAEPLDKKFQALELEALAEVYHRPRGATELRSGPRIVRAWRTHAVRPHRAISVCQTA